jgi:hypothetical protein
VRCIYELLRKHAVIQVMVQKTKQTLLIDILFVSRQAKFNQPAVFTLNSNLERNFKFFSVIIFGKLLNFEFLR